MTNIGHRTEEMEKAFNEILGICPKHGDDFARAFFDHFDCYQATIPTLVKIEHFATVHKPMSGWRTPRDKPWKYTKTKGIQIQQLLVFAKEYEMCWQNE